jgi:hypothetical protein
VSAPLIVSIYVMWGLLLILALAVFALYRHFGQLYVNSPQGREDQGPAVGSALLSIASRDTDGEEILLPTTRPTLILFVETTCDLCSALRDQLNALAPHSDVLDTVALCAGALPDVRAWASRTPPYVRVAHDRRASAANRYEVNGTPFIVAVGQDGNVRAKGVVNDREGLAWAAEQALSAPAGSELGLDDATEEVVRT